MDISCEINDAEQPEYYFILSFSNNGAKLQKRYEKKHFIKLGKKSSKGTGSGGFYLNDIATSFGNPDWEFIIDSKEKLDNFTPSLTYKFKFKIYEG
jgi:type I restriction enzyme M protein